MISHNMYSKKKLTVKRRSTAYAPRLAAWPTAPVKWKFYF